jgi:dihydrodipicolinate synthase/N-acetylneuraminate lyase
MTLDPGTNQAWRPRGVVVPLLTPFAGSNVDIESLGRLVDSVVADVDTLVVLGTTGEQVFLTDEQGQRAVEAVLQYAADRCPVVVGIAAPGTHRAVADIHRLVRPGVAGVLVTSGFYFRASPGELSHHFRTVADASPVPVALYNIPQHTGNPLPPEVVAELATHPNIVGMKDSAGDIFAFQDYLRRTPEDFAVLQGREQLTAVSSALGSPGIVSALANMVPSALRTLHELAAAGDPRARELHRAVLTLTDVYADRDFIAILKAVLAARGTLTTPALARPGADSTVDTQVLAAWQAAEDALNEVLARLTP